LGEVPDQLEDEGASQPALIDSDVQLVVLAVQAPAPVPALTLLDDPVRGAVWPADKLIMEPRYSPRLASMEPAKYIYIVDKATMRKT
jgi:hypothetical protein